MQSPSDRLRDAREKAGFDKAKTAAEAMGVPVATYIQHENGTRGFPTGTAERYATFFRTTPEWLLYGRAKDRGEALARIIGHVGADTSGSVIMATAHERWDMAPRPPGATSRSVALEVSGHSMNTFAPDGSLIYFEDQQTPPTADLLRQVCVVETEDGRVLVKRLMRGSAQGLYNLESDVGPPIEDVRLRWAAEVTAVIPPRQAHRIIVRGAESAA